MDFNLIGRISGGKLGGSALARLPLLRSGRKGIAKQKISSWDWIFAPALICALASLILSAPIKVTGLVLPEPVLALVLAFCWPLIRPSYLAPFVILLLGLFLERLWGAPTGLYSLLLILVYGFFLSVRSFIVGQETMVVSAIYALTSFVFFTVGTLIVSWQSGSVPRLIGVAEQMIATALCFPFVAYMLDTYVHADVRFQ